MTDPSFSADGRSAIHFPISRSIAPLRSPKCARSVPLCEQAEIFIARRVGQISTRANVVYLNMAFNGEFTPVLARHSKSFSLIDCISVGVDRMHRNFEPMRKQVEAWQRSELTDVTAKVVIYEAFVEGKLEAPKHLARTVHDLYFEPKYEEFNPRTIWSLSNAFTSAFKELDPILQFKATAKLGEYLEARFSQSF